MSKRKILVFSSYYLPGYNAGGPIRSLENIFNYMSKEVEFYLVTLNKDHGSDVPYENIKFNSWTKVGMVNVFYLSESRPKVNFIKKLINEINPETLYLNSLFALDFSILIFLSLYLIKIDSVRVVLAPRGELSKGALEQSKFRKFFFIVLTRNFQIYKNITWHASSRFECADIRREYGDRCNIHIASNLVNNINALRFTPSPSMQKKGSIKLIFLSRISKKKNLGFAIESLSSLIGKVVFDIYGPFEDLTYVTHCKLIALKLPDNIKVTFKGDVSHDKVTELFRRYDLFYFPTKGENFGQVIWEALSSGCPVLISDQTPWEELRSYNAGWSFSLSEKKNFTTLLQKIINKDIGYDLDRFGAHRYALKFGNTKKSLLDNEKLFFNQN